MMEAEYVYPHWWVQVPEEKKASVVNGCGPAGWKAALIPDTIWGLSIYEPCCIHDGEYTYSPSTRASADARFLANMCIACARGSAWLLPFRLHRAMLYYLAVRAGGARYFKGDTSWLKTL